jgi:hypothetical protein
MCALSWRCCVVVLQRFRLDILHHDFGEVILREPWNQRAVCHAVPSFEELDHCLWVPQVKAEVG